MGFEKDSLYRCPETLSKHTAVIKSLHGLPVVFYIDLERKGNQLFDGPREDSTGQAMP